MADIAKMRFQSAKKPDESGVIALTSDGNLRIDPSDEFVEAMAALEQQAVERAGRYSKVASLTLIGLGLTVAVIGWLAGRVGGKLRERLTGTRRVGRTRIEHDPERGFRLMLENGPLGTTSMTWSPGEYDADEAAQFHEIYRQVRRISEAEE